MSKTKQVWNHLNKIGSISSLEAISLFVVTHVQDMVYKWRQRGEFIVSVDMNSTSKDGERCQYCRYYLPEVMTNEEREALLALLKIRLGENYKNKLAGGIEWQIIRMVDKFPHLNGKQ